MPRDPHAHTLFPPTTSLSRPVFEPHAATIYARALDALQDGGVEALVGGALAVNAHTGIWRDTKDLDVFVRPRDARRALSALEAGGFEPSMVYEEWLGKAWDGDVFVDIIWRNANGLFPPNDSWFERAVTRDVLGRSVPMLPVEELILSKIMVGGRYRFDGADILHAIHASHGRIDWDHLQEAAGEHVGLVVAYLHMYRWGYPGFADRVPDTVMRRLTEAAGRAGSSFGPFRARLLDLQSFHVDVDGWRLPDPHGVVMEGIEAEGRARP